MKLDKELEAYLTPCEAWLARPKTHAALDKEREFMRQYVPQGNFGEKVVWALLESSGKTVWKPERRNGLLPDLETDEAIYEVKARTYATIGTAGEKILGTPLKYIDVPELYGKPLYIVLIGYQEYEAENCFHLFGGGSARREATLALWQSYNIWFIKGSELFEGICTE